MFKVVKYWKIILPLVLLALITGKAAYGYWVEQVQADWELTFACDTTVLITGLELPEIPLAPLPLEEELEPIEEEAHEQDADVLPQENEPTPDADAGQEGPSPDAGSDTGDIPTGETNTNAGADETAVTEQEDPAQETDIVPEEQAPGIDDLTEDKPSQDGAADSNENQIPGADGAADNVENGSAPVDSSGEDSGNNGSAPAESSGENSDD